ncbi:MAG: CBS domain-containing protein [Bacteroidota bacterium]
MFDFDVRSGHDPVSPELLAGLSQGRALPADLSEPVTRIPRRAPLVVPPSFPLRSTLKVMAERHAAAALVASHGVLLGMLGEREIVRRLVDGNIASADLPVGEVMTAEVETLFESDTVAYAVRKLWTLGGRPLPIVTPNGGLWGLLETHDVVSWLCGRMGAAGPKPLNDAL